MAKPAKSETVPKAMQEKFDSITAITNEFAQQHLNEDYATLIRQAAAALCRKRPSPLASGRAKSWACGITHAIGMVNFLYDPSQDPHISASDLYAAFGVGASTGQGKSKQVRDTLKTHQMDSNWSIPAMIDKNPLVWMVQTSSGMIIDARSAPPEVQMRMAEAGLIPYAPGAATASGQDSSQGAKSSRQEAAKPAGRRDSDAPPRSPDALYVLDASIIDGPLTEAFLEENPQITRTVEIKGSQNLKALHQILFKAFDREEEHLHEFQVGGRGPRDPNARRYGISASFDGDLDGDVETTTLNSLNLAVGEVFGYWFDFGDDWWHMIEVKEIQPKAGKGRFPKVTRRVGASPPQYAEF
ncbi:MAG: plasmid pRiA4b ORF-3 family protein [Cyanobacteria bacterium P01_A01_bin.135]